MVGYCILILGKWLFLSRFISIAILNAIKQASYMIINLRRAAAQRSTGVNATTDTLDIGSIHFQQTITPGISHISCQSAVALDATIGSSEELKGINSIHVVKYSGGSY